MKPTTNIHALRDGTINTDRAILDLLHLEQLGLAPGVASVALLKVLWGCSQPMVSRRMTAIDGFGLYRVRSGWGRYTLIQPRHEKPQATSRERWEAVRRQLPPLGLLQLHRLPPPRGSPTTAASTTRFHFESYSTNDSLATHYQHV